MFADRARESTGRSVGDTKLTCLGSRNRAGYLTDDKFFTAINHCGADGKSCRFGEAPCSAAKRSSSLRLSSARNSSARSANAD